MILQRTEHPDWLTNAYLLADTDRKGVLIDGMGDDDTCNRLLGAIEHGLIQPMRNGSIQGLPLTIGLDLSADRRWTRTSGDQSNSLAFVNQKYVLKIFRRVEAGPNPDLEISRFLMGHGFTRIPPLAGALSYQRPGLDDGILALLMTSLACWFRMSMASAMSRRGTVTTAS